MNDTIDQKEKKIFHKNNGMDTCRKLATKNILIMIYDAKKNNATQPDKFQLFFGNPGFNYRQLTDVAHERGCVTQLVLSTEYEYFIDNLKRQKDSDQ